MKYILITNIIYELTNSYDYFTNEELYIKIENNLYNNRFDLNILNNNFWNYNDKIFIPFSDKLVIKIFDKDISKDDVVFCEEFDIGNEYKKNNLQLKYQIIEIVDIAVYTNEKTKILSEIDYLSNQNDRKVVIINTLKQKIKNLNDYNRVCLMKNKDLEKKINSLNKLKMDIIKLLN